MSKNSFDYSLDFDTIDFRQHPELYRIGKGEQGVLLVEPYKSEILPFWRFKSVGIAKESAKKIYSMFENYLHQHEFIGADMARKFLQMGFTRARRYANHKGGRKYNGNVVLPQEKDALTNEKAMAAAVFKEYWFKAKDHPDYLKQKQDFKKKYYK